MTQREYEGQRHVLMASSRDQELQLILDEERAERRVARAKERLERAYRRLDRAERRVDRRTRRLSNAEAQLAACQQRRALGPSLSLEETAADVGSGTEPAGSEPANAVAEEVDESPA
jgi:hypothetical protein